MRSKSVWFSAAGICLAAALVGVGLVAALAAHEIPGNGDPDKKCRPTPDTSCITCDMSDDTFQCSKTTPPEGFVYGMCEFSPGDRCPNTTQYCGGLDQVLNCETPPELISGVGSGCGADKHVCKPIQK